MIITKDLPQYETKFGEHNIIGNKTSNQSNRKKNDK